MRSDTSGLMFTQNKDGSIRVEVVDYDVEWFDGSDWESWYDLDKENADKLFNELSLIHGCTFKEMLIKEFTETFDTRHFEKFCKDRGIKYKHMTWTS